MDNFRVTMDFVGYTDVSWRVIKNLRTGTKSYLRMDHIVLGEN